MRWRRDRAALRRVRDLMEQDGWRGSTYAAAILRAIDDE